MWPLATVLMAVPRLGASLAATPPSLIAVLGLVSASSELSAANCGYSWPAFGGDTLTCFKEFTPG